MTQEQLDTINTLLKSNITPEKIYDAALKELRKIQEQNEQEKKWEKVRTSLLSAAKEYLTALNIPVTPEEFTQAEQTLKNIENLLRKSGPVPDKKTAEALLNKYTNFNPDEIFKTFFKTYKF
jgi:arginyl-tRNA synthetase